MIFKNVINQGLYVKAIDKTTGAGKTGDAANITANWSKDGGATAALNDSNPTEIGGGVYHFDITQAESNCDRFSLTPSSTTSDVLVSPVFGFTQAGAIPTAAPGANGGLPTVDANNRIAGMQGTVNNLNNLDAAVSSRSSHNADAVRDALLDRELAGNHDTAGTAGLLLQFLDAAISSRSSHGAPNLANLDAAVSTRSSHDADAVRDALLDRVLAGNHDTAGTAGKLLQFLDAAISSRSSHGAPDLSNLDAAVSTRSSHGAPNLANLDVAVSTRSALDSAAVQAACNVALVALHLDHLLDQAYDPASKPGAAAALLNVLVEDNGGVPRLTAAALAQAPSGGGGSAPTKEEVAAEVDVVLSAAHGGGSWSAGGSGSGAYTITATVKEGATPLENAVVRVTEGANTYTASTNASGQAVFALDAATFAVAVTKDGYSHTPESRTVTGAEAGTLTNDLLMTATTIPAAPADPDYCNVFGYIEALAGNDADDVSIAVDLVVPDRGAVKSGPILAFRTATIAVAADGTITVTALPRNDVATPATSYYLLTCAELGWSKKKMELEAATYDLADLIS